MIVVLCGGFGAARFVEGFGAFAGELTCVVNVGDDFDYFGVRVCPDLDSVLYALAGCFDEDRGWGPVDDTFAAHEALARYTSTWFRLGDRDLALSLRRTALLAEGRPLSAVTAPLAAALDVSATVLPATDQPVPTRVRTPDGWLDFQEFVVREQARPAVLEVAYDGAMESSPAPGVVPLIERTELVVIAPSNPVSSIGPILAVPGIREALVERSGPTIAVSPVVSATPPRTEAERSRAVLREVVLRALGIDHRASAIAESYGDLIDGFVVDLRDERDERPAIEAQGLAVLAADTLAATGPARAELARAVVDFGRSLKRLRQ